MVRIRHTQVFFYPLAYAFSVAANRAPKVNLIGKRIERSLNRTCCPSSSLSVLEDKTPLPVNAAASTNPD